MSHPVDTPLRDDPRLASQDRVPYEEPHEDEGHSVAAWAGVVTMLLGCAIAAVAIFFDAWTFVWIGAGIVALGIILWPLLKAFGLGPKSE